MELNKAEILATLRELYLDVDVPAPVRLKAAEVCLGYVEKKSGATEEKKEDQNVGDAFKQLMEALKD